MTLIEVAIAIGIFSAVMLGTTALFASLWKMQGFTMRLGMSSQQATHVVTRMTDQIRDARQADNGAYVIVAASPTELVVYTDYDRDGATERVRFFRDGNVLRRGVVEPSSTVPVIYDTATETVRIIAKDIVDTADGTPLFMYYDKNNAVLSGTPAIDDIRMVRITVTVDTDTATPPDGVVISSFASLRNLRTW